jgi:hypothetical protein
MLKLDATAVAGDGYEGDRGLGMLKLDAKAGAGGSCVGDSGLGFQWRDSRALCDPAGESNQLGSLLLFSRYSDSVNREA